MAETGTARTGSERRGIGLAVTVAAAGGLLFGYDTGVISGALLFLAPEFGLGDAGQQVLVGGLLAGALVGALAGGWISDALGRKKTLVGVAAVFLVGALLSGLAPGVATLVVARVVLGLAIGVSSVCVPTYIAEIAPKARRGLLVSLHQFLVAFGILVSYLVNFAFAPAESWRWPLALAAVPALAMLVGLLGASESPRWLVLRGRTEEATDVLLGSRDPAEARAEIDEIVATAREESRWSWSDLLRPELRPALMVGIGIAAVNQLVGVNAVIYYAPTILQGVFGSAGAILATVGIGIVNAAFALIALLRIDAWGRRPLLLGGLALVVVSLVALVVLFLLPDRSGVVGILIVVALCVYIAAFAASLGMIWLVNSEVFPTAVRGKAAGLGAGTHWGLDLVIASTALTLITTFGEAGLFAIFAVIGVGGFVFLYKLMPETKGKSLEEIDAELRARTGRA